MKLGHRLTGYHGRSDVISAAAVFFTQARMRTLDTRVVNIVAVSTNHGAGAIYAMHERGLLACPSALLPASPGSLGRHRSADSAVPAHPGSDCHTARAASAPRCDRIPTE